MRMRCCICIAVALVLVAGAGAIHAAWIENGNPVSAPAYHQLYVQMIRSEDGTFILTWHDNRVGPGNFDIYAQKIDADGNPVWTADGVLVQGDTGLERYPRLVTDGAGGAIIVWEDFRSGMELYAQRIDADGNKLWSTYGEPVCTQSSDQQNARLIPDGAGGAIIVWEDWRNSPYWDLYIQRIDGNGDPYWTVNGEPLFTMSTNNRFGPELVTDGDYGAIVTWYESRSGHYNIYAQRVSSAGTTVWTDNGENVCTAAEAQTVPRIVSDGFDGAIISWLDYRSGTNYDIYAQRINLAGITQWAGNGVAICTDAGDQDGPEITTDGNAGAIIGWLDHRSSSGRVDVYAQRVDVNGNTQWAADGICVSNALGSKYSLALDADGFGGAVFAWQDFRVFGGSIYAQRIDGNGSEVWSMNDVAVCTAEGNQEVPKVISDGAGGAIIAWHDYRTGEYDVYAQRVERNGNWGYPAPHISGVRDVPGDEGGLVNLSWDASRLDPWPYMDITHYTVWRAIDPVAALLMIDGGARLISEAGEPVLRGELPRADQPLIRRELLGAETYYWYLIDTVESYYLSSYSAPEPTMFDSTATSDELHYFQVIAHTSDPAVFWTSPPDSGYSVDNLAPCPPLALAGEQSYVPEGLTLTWEPNTETDLDGYAIYRGVGPDFVPGPVSFLTAPCDTFYFDGDWRWDSGYCYKVVAVDIHGNESGCTLLCSDAVTGAETPEAPQLSFLAQNYPNPFNPATTIVFGLAAPAHVSLNVYDAAGRLVRVLVDGNRQANHYAVTWDGRDDAGRAVKSGVFFYELRAGAFSETRKMVLLR